MIKLIRYSPGGEENCGEGLMNDGLHLPGIDDHLSETLCGACDTMAEYEIIEGDKPTCKNCISAVKQIFKTYKKIDVKKW